MTSSGRWRSVPTGTLCPSCGKEVKRGRGGLRCSDTAWKCFKCQATGPIRYGKLVLKGKQTFVPHRENFNRRTATPTPILKTWTGADFRAFASLEPACNLYTYCVATFGEKTARSIWRRYGVGTAGKGATVFPAVDEQGRIRDVKTMRYGTDSKRIKDGSLSVWTPPTFSSSARRALLFGHHLVKSSEQIIVLVESEKTALFCACLALNDGRNDVVYLATGGTSGFQRRLQESKVQLMRSKAHQLLIWPDNDNAGTKAAQLAYNTLNFWRLPVKLCLLTKLWPEAQDGDDLADFLLACLAQGDTYEPEIPPAESISTPLKLPEWPAGFDDADLLEYAEPGSGLYKQLMLKRLIDTFGLVKVPWDC